MNADATRRAARVWLARRLYEARVDRRLFFREALFGETGWDSLLALYVSRATGQKVSAGQLQTASGETSLSTALRTQQRLADVGLIRRFADLMDRRRTLIELTPLGLQRLDAYLEHLLNNYLPSARAQTLGGAANGDSPEAARLRSAPDKIEGEVAE